MTEPGAPLRAADVVVILRATEPYSRLPEALLAELAEAAQTVRLGAGQFLVYPGDESRGVYVVLNGTLKLAFSSQGGEEKVLELLTSGRNFGQGELFAGRPFSYAIEALTECRLLLLPAAVVQQLVARDGAFAGSMLRCLGVQFHSLARNVESLSTQSAMQRVVQFLENRVVDVDRGAATVELLTRKGVLASRLGVTPETLSRILRELTGRGLITVNGERLQVHDVAALRGLREQLSRG